MASALFIPGVGVKSNPKLSAGRPIKKIKKVCKIRRSNVILIWKGQVEGNLFALSSKLKNWQFGMRTAVNGGVGKPL